MFSRKRPILFVVETNNHKHISSFLERMDLSMEPVFDGQKPGKLFDKIHFASEIDCCLGFFYANNGFIFVLEKTNNSVMVKDKIFSHFHIKRHKNVAVAIATEGSKRVIVHRYNVCAEKIYKYVLVSLEKDSPKDGMSQLFKPLDMQVCVLETVGRTYVRVDIYCQI